MLAGVALMEAGVLVRLLLLGVIPVQNTIQNRRIHSPRTVTGLKLKVKNKVETFVLARSCLTRAWCGQDCMVGKLREGKGTIPAFAAWPTWLKEQLLGELHGR